MGGYGNQVIVKAFGHLAFFSYLVAIFRDCYIYIVVNSFVVSDQSDHSMAFVKRESRTTHK